MDIQATMLADPSLDSQFGSVQDGSLSKRWVTCRNDDVTFGKVACNLVLLGLSLCQDIDST